MTRPRCECDWREARRRRRHPTEQMLLETTSTPCRRLVLQETPQRGGCRRRGVEGAAAAGEAATGHLVCRDEGFGDADGDGRRSRCCWRQATRKREEDGNRRGRSALASGLASAA